MGRAIAGGLGVAMALVWGSTAMAQPPPAVGEADEEAKNAGFLVDVNLGVPVLELGTVNVIGDGLLGYQGERFGGKVSGSFDVYGHLSSVSLVTSRRLGLTIDLWGGFSDSSGGRWELRPSVGWWSYRSFRVDAGNDEDLTSFAEASLMTRVNMGVGYRREPPSGERGFSVWVGVGGQLEGYVSGLVNLSELDATLGADATLTGSVSWRVRAFTRLGEALLLRGESEGVYFSITKDAATLAFDEAFTGSVSRTEATQLDMINRLNLDWPGGAVLGFVPLVNVGLDLYRTSAEGLPTANLLVPSGGVGLRRAAF